LRLVAGSSRQSRTQRGPRPSPAGRRPCRSTGAAGRGRPGGGAARRSAARRV